MIRLGGKLCRRSAVHLAGQWDGAPNVQAQPGRCLHLHHHPPPDRHLPAEHQGRGPRRPGGVHPTAVWERPSGVLRVSLSPQSCPQYDTPCSSHCCTTRYPPPPRATLISSGSESPPNKGCDVAEISSCLPPPPCSKHRVATHWLPLSLLISIYAPLGGGSTYLGTALHTPPCHRSRASTRQPTCLIGRFPPGPCRTGCAWTVVRLLHQGSCLRRPHLGPLEEDCHCCLAPFVWPC